MTGSSPTATMSSLTTPPLTILSAMQHQVGALGRAQMRVEDRLHRVTCLGVSNRGIGMLTLKPGDGETELWGGTSSTERKGSCCRRCWIRPQMRSRRRCVEFLKRCTRTRRGRCDGSQWTNKSSWNGWCKTHAWYTLEVDGWAAAGTNGIARCSWLCKHAE